MENIDHMQLNDITDENDTLCAASATSFGCMLKELRENSGFTVQRAAVATRIAQPFIEALEQDEPHKLPASVFGRGFIRNLCKVYGADPEPVLCAFELSTGVPKNSAVVPEENPLALSAKRKLRLDPYTRIKDVLSAWPMRIGSKVARHKVWMVILAGTGSTMTGSWFLWSHLQQSQSEKALSVENVNVAQPSLVEEKLLPAHGSKKAASFADPEKSEGSQIVSANQNQVSLEKKSQVESANEVTSVSAKILSPTTIEIDRHDGKGFQELSLQEGAEKFSFETSMTLLIKDTSTIELSFAGRSLGDLTSRGKTRKITFHAASLKAN